MAAPAGGAAAATAEEQASVPPLPVDDATGPLPGLLAAEGVVERRLGSRSAAGGAAAVVVDDRAANTVLRHGSSRVAAGDLVLLSAGSDTRVAFLATAGEHVQTRFGYFRHEDVIGSVYGSWVESHGRGGASMQVLRPTCELWAASLERRTQILFPHDTAVIVAGLSLRPGQHVVESGTGSGVLTHSLARSVAPMGRVSTFELNGGRAEAARADFAAHGLGDVITVTQSNACDEGFVGIVDGSAHAVFLDLPSPWDAIDEADRVLVKDGRLCSFSPCIEQVQRACNKMRELGFRDLRTVEVRHRSGRTHVVQQPALDLAPWHVKLAAELEQARRARPTPLPPSPASSSASEAESAARLARKRPAPGSEAETATASSESSAAPSDSSTSPPPPPPPSSSAAAAAAAAAAAGEQASSSTAAPEAEADVTRPTKRNYAKSRDMDVATDDARLVIEPEEIVYGHTGYLTFARRRIGPKPSAAAAAAAALADAADAAGDSEDDS